MLEITGLDDLPAPSSFMSSRWSRDNLVTAHPAQLYDGPVSERLGPESLDYLMQDLVRQRGPLEVRAGRMGVYTWDVTCEDEAGAFVLQVPLALDEPGTHGRAKREVPRQNVENARYFIERGLTRFVAPPEGCLTLAGNVPAAIFGALEQHLPILFGTGALRVRLGDGWTVGLGPSASADLLAEMVAALVYHYEPDVEGGSAVTDVFVNDGDFVARRRADGSFDVRLTATRWRERGIGPNLLLLYLVQMMAYEDFSVAGGLTGLPVLMSNPAVTFEGVVRGLCYRFRDLGGHEEDGVREAKRWISAFGRSREGRAYRPWVECFLEGRLPLHFGHDPRERWWRLFPLQRKQHLLELRGRHDPSSGAAESARQVKVFLDRLTREIGRLPEQDPAVHYLNDLAGDGMRRVLAEANVEAAGLDAVAAEIFALWPQRSLDQLLARVPRARGLRRLKSRLSFGSVLSLADEGTLKRFGPGSKAGGPARALANPELYGSFFVPQPLHALAVQAFLTFEAYTDAALHDPAWGYYGHHVVIGKGGHFDTHPEELSPHYGLWLAVWAFKAWRDMLAHGELSEADQFPLIEFGAGNGRLARDVVDAVARRASDPATRDGEHWKTFESRLEYRIYEMSDALRERQRELLGTRALVAPGDARRPAETLKRDFPDGVKGFVVTNEVPDAFGVHKVALASDGRAFAALVVPRVEGKLVAALEPDLARRIETADATLRETFGFADNVGDRYLDRDGFAELMEAVSGLAVDARESALSSLWFEEAYVPASVLPELAALLAASARDYAAALAAEESGVVLYVNVHAGSFVRELGSSLGAGFVVTIDYGDSTWELVQGARRGDFPFRVYGESQDFRPRPNDPYAAPGTQDLTADVNFTDLARAGQKAGLELIHFGPERDVAGDALPEVLRSAAEADPFTKFLGHPGFKVLVLGTRQSTAFANSLMTPLPLTRREQGLSTSQREKISELERTLSALVTPKSRP
jgi:SAM-dependent MidA family methyltransferase